MALTALEAWELGVALIAGREGKVAGRWMLERGAGENYSGYGYAIRSHGGKLCLGNAKQPVNSATFDAAPGDNENVLCTLIEPGTRSYAVVIRAEQPVLWRAQPSIEMKGQNHHHALWTEGMATEGLVYSFNVDGKRSALKFDYGRDPLHWAIGYAANGAPACVVFGFGEADRFAGIDGKPLAAPSGDELAEVRSRPHPAALPAGDLAQLGVQIAREGKRAFRRTKHAKAFRQLAKFTSKIGVSIAANATGLVPSKKGTLMLGRLDDPKGAVELALGGGTTNRKLIVYVEASSRKRTLEVLIGVRLGDAPAVRWAIEGELSSGPVWHGYRDIKEEHHRNAVVALWTPGIERTSPLFDPATTRIDEGAGITTLSCDQNDPLVWLVGYDADDEPAIVLVGSRRIAELFDHGRAGLGDVTATAKTQRKAKAEAEAAAKAALALPVASATELAAIAAAIAAGPKQKPKLGGRFSIQWDRTAIPSVKGKVVVGDPGGATFQLKASTGALPTFEFCDAKDDASEGEGRAIVGVRLGEGKAVTWKRGGDIGVDSGHYGVWSPGFATGDLDEGTHTKGSLVAKIVKTAEGDCVFTSLVGLDARKQPVAFLFGEALRRDVFAAR